MCPHFNGYSILYGYEQTTILNLWSLSTYRPDTERKQESFLLLAFPLALKSKFKQLHPKPWVLHSGSDVRGWQIVFYSVRHVTLRETVKHSNANRYHREARMHLEAGSHSTVVTYIQIKWHTNCEDDKLVKKAYWYKIGLKWDWE